MKKLILLLILGMCSCTFQYASNTAVHCPCIVNKVEMRGDKYRIEVRPVDDEAQGVFFTFYSTYQYQLRDTIR